MPWHLRRRDGLCHLERLAQAGALTGINRERPVVAVSVAFRIRREGDDPHVDGHVIPQVLIPGNEGGAVIIFKADPVPALIDAVEVLDRRHDGVRGIMRIDLDSHGDASPRLILI